jgi:PadR family transcriptional regulator PadR
VQFLAEHDGIELTESTVYPLLARLAREGCLSLSTKPSPTGPPRRYYRLTPAGRKSLEAMSRSWQVVDASIHKIVQTNGSKETRT